MHKRVYASADPPNSASIRVMDRLGMVFDSHRIIHGLDAVYHAIDRRAFESLHGT